MKLWAIVPVKPMGQAKSRLAGVLSDDARRALSYELIKRTLEAVSDVPEIERVLIISKDHDVLRLANTYGAMMVWEKGQLPDLNRALRQATSVAADGGAEAIMVLPTDLPLITCNEIRNFIASIRRPPEIIIAPDRRREGTNALLLNPYDILEYQYGEKSFQAHVLQAQEKEVGVSVYVSPVFQFDLDLPEDLRLLQSSEISLSLLSVCS